MTTAVEPVTTPEPTVAPAPVTTPVAAPPVEPVIPPTPALSPRQEARQQATERMKQALAPKTEPEKPVAPATPPVAEAPKPEATGATTLPAPVTAESAEPATPAEPPKGIRVAIEGTHPILGGRKIEAITVSTPEEEWLVKALINSTGVRRSELDRLQRQLQESEESRRTMQRQLIERETLEGARSEWEGTESYQKALETYYQIKETQGDTAALAFWKGAQLEFHQNAQTKLQERVTAVEAEEAERQARVWGEDAYERTASWLPEQIRSLPEYGKYFQEALREFDAAMALGHFPEAVDYESMHKAFVPYFQARLMSKTTVRETLARVRDSKQQQDAAAQQASAKAQQEREALKRQAVEDYLKAEAAKRTAAPLNPLAAVASTSRPAPATALEPAPQQPPQPGHTAKRAARLAAASLAKQRFGGT